MRVVCLEDADPTATKGWYAGPWESSLAVAVGWARAAIDQPHLHERLTELYLVARGTATARVEGETIALVAGDLLIVEPGEAHTFLDSSADYLHFVIHVPEATGAGAGTEKRPVPRSRLGLSPIDVADVAV